jgi:tRNA threonylcarbamoyladenosine biosynthesis protein TsaE
MNSGQFVAGLEPAGNSATVVTLSGELGAGKTTFAQGMARALGVEETVTSPTFVIEKIYQLENQKFARLVHIDAYRLKSAHELEVLGWKELLADPGNLIVLEWPEQVAEAIPADAIRIRFDIQGDERIISINGEDSGKK